MAAQVSLEGLEERVLLLPEEALVDYQRGQAVFVVRNGVAELRRPRLGVGLGEHIRVLGGLDTGDEVIVSNLARVRDGLSVERRSQTAP
jgi:membrane fusion protein (multidrug efflux system)